MPAPPGGATPAWGAPGRRPLGQGRQRPSGPLLPGVLSPGASVQFHEVCRAEVAGRGPGCPQDSHEAPKGLPRILPQLALPHRPRLLETCLSPVAHAENLSRPGGPGKVPDALNEEGEEWLEGGRPVGTAARKPALRPMTPNGLSRWPRPQTAPAEPVTLSDRTAALSAQRWRKPLPPTAAESTAHSLTPGCSTPPSGSGVPGAPPPEGHPHPVTSNIPRQSPHPGTSPATAPTCSPWVGI